MSWLSNLFSKDEQQPSEASTPPKPMVTAADYCKQGQNSLDAGKYVEAMEYFQAAMETDKRFEIAYLLLSEVYEKQGKTDKAKATLYALLAVEPDNRKALDKINGLDGNRILKEIPKPNTPMKPAVTSSKPLKTSQMTKAGEISFKITKWFWFLLCFTEFVISIVIAIGIGSFDRFFDGGFELGLTIVLALSFFFAFFVYRVFYLLIYRRDNWNGDRFGKGNYNPIVYKVIRNIICIVFLISAIIAFIYLVCVLCDI